MEIPCGKSVSTQNFVGGSFISISVSPSMTVSFSFSFIKIFLLFILAAVADFLSADESPISVINSLFLN